VKSKISTNREHWNKWH